MGLNLVTMVPISEVHFLALDAFRIILYVAGIVLIFAILLSMLVSGKIVRPIEELSRHMKRGSTEMIGESASSAEIDVLYRSFNELMQKLKQADLELAEAFEKEKEANLRALQAQINPHFIYNTLNSVSCMALLHQENEISQVLGSLTKVIRYNLKNRMRSCIWKKNWKIFTAGAGFRNAAMNRAFGFPMIFRFPRIRSKFRS
ncbi:MAG: sensor histidine kinase [Gallintestinimicrobium sp.]